MGEEEGGGEEEGRGRGWEWELGVGARGICGGGGGKEEWGKEGFGSFGRVGC